MRKRTETPDLERLAPREQAAWGGFLRTHATVVRRLDADVRARHGISLSAYEALLFLGRAPGGRLRMCDLAGGVVLTPSGITRVVDRLVAEGLVERCGDESDGRARYARLTEAGAERLEAAQRTHLAGVRAAFLDHLAERDVDLLATTWERLGSTAGPRAP